MASKLPLLGKPYIAAAYKPETSLTKEVAEPLQPAPNKSSTDCNMVIFIDTKQQIRIHDIN
jgi:hypothetical protein